MNEEVLNIVGIVLIVSSFIVLIVVRTKSERPSRAQKLKDANAAQKLIENATGHNLQVDWMQYRGASKQRITKVANKYGWHHVGDEISGRSWFLNFDKNPHAAVRSAQANDPHKQLAAELSAATPDVKGRYVLDTTSYAELGTTAIEQAVTSAGWQTVRTGLDRELVLARPGTTTAEFSHGPFLEGASPDTLRSDPAVAERAREIERIKGFDPLSETTLNHARERNKYWSKSFNRQGLLATFYAVVGFLALGISIGSVPDGFPEKWIAFAITCIVLALCAIAMMKARIIHKKRKSEFGDVIAAYQELQQLYRQRHSE